MTSDEFVKHIIYNNIEIDIGLDDAGQTYFIEYKDDNGNLHTECVGAYIQGYMDYIEYRFGKPEINCPIYHQIKTSETESCRTINKSFCTSCRKFFNDLAWEAKERRNREFEKWLKENKNENNIT